MKSLLLIAASLFIFQSCTSWKYKDGYNENEVQAPPTAQEAPAQPPVAGVPAAAAQPVAQEEEPLTKYSDMSNLAPSSDRQYKRMTRQKMEEDSELYGSAGSLWKMEGQTSYLFAENKHRREGDPTTIKMEGVALKVIESKVAVIQDLLKELDAQKKQAEEDAKKAEEEKIRLAQAEEEKKLRAERIAKGEIVVDPFEDQFPAEPVRSPAAVAPTVAAKPEVEEKVDLKELDVIPSKIVEKMSDGIYRIRGQQFLTIKKKPYKVIATALIRAEDFADANVSSNKLLDAQYDVIHVKRTAE
jgi:flagellar L-ring protein FlgH